MHVFVGYNDALLVFAAIEPTVTQWVVGVVGLLILTKLGGMGGAIKNSR